MLARTLMPLLLTLCLAWPAVPAALASPPKEGRWRTPLGTFELDPTLRERLRSLERSLSETALALRALLEQKARLTPEQEERLRELMDRLREELRRLEEPGDEGSPKQVLGPERPYLA